MKTFFAAILALVALCTISRADNILIYKGIESQRDNNASVKRYGYYWLFDQTTQQFEGVQFGPLGSLATAANKYYSTGTNASYVYVPATEKGARTQTDFVYTSGSAVSPFAITFGDYKGGNTSHTDLGGTFTGEFPNTLTLVARIVDGNGTTGDDTVSIIGGTFALAVKLTRSSNGSGDDLPTAIGIVIDALKKAGYSAE